MVGNNERKRLIDQHSREPVFLAAAAAIGAAGVLGLIGILSLAAPGTAGDSVVAPTAVGVDASAAPVKVRADSD